MTCMLHLRAVRPAHEEFTPGPHPAPIKRYVEI